MCFFLVPVTVTRGISWPPNPSSFLPSPNHARSLPFHLQWVDFRKLSVLEKQRRANVFQMCWTRVFCAFTLIQLSVFGAVAEGNSISDWSIREGFRILSFNLVSAEDSVLITVKLWLGDHQTGVVFCTSVFYTWQCKTSSLARFHFLPTNDHPLLCCDMKGKWKPSLQSSVTACTTATTDVKTDLGGLWQTVGQTVFGLHHRLWNVNRRI